LNHGGHRGHGGKAGFALCSPWPPWFNPVRPSFELDPGLCSLELASELW